MLASVLFEELLMPMMSIMPSLFMSPQLKAWSVNGIVEPEGGAICSKSVPLHNSHSTGYVAAVVPQVRHLHQF